MRARACTLDAKAALVASLFRPCGSGRLPCCLIDASPLRVLMLFATAASSSFPWRLTGQSPMRHAVLSVSAFTCLRQDRYGKGVIFFSEVSAAVAEGSLQ